tara:strand:+ start:198 stop:548 length:351 start_codon:yes stop_codon:yes gene_type:complete
MATRYKVTKEQVEKLVESFVMESVSPEAKKHIQGNVTDEKVGHSPKTSDGRGSRKQAPEAKKHVKGSEGSDMVEERPNTPKVSADKKKLSQATDAKKHVKGSVAENARRMRTLRKK